MRRGNRARPIHKMHFFKISGTLSFCLRHLFPASSFDRNKYWSSFQVRSNQPTPLLPCVCTVLTALEKNYWLLCLSYLKRKNVLFAFEYLESTMRQRTFTNVHWINKMSETDTKPGLGNTSQIVSHRTGDTSQTWQLTSTHAHVAILQRAAFRSNRQCWRPKHCLWKIWIWKWEMRDRFRLLVTTLPWVASGLAVRVSGSQSLFCQSLLEKNLIVQIMKMVCRCQIEKGLDFWTQSTEACHCSHFLICGLQTLNPMNLQDPFQP